MSAPTVRLVPYDRTYLALSWDWLHDPEIRDMTMTADFTRKQQEAFFDSLPTRKDYRIWGLEADGEPAGAGGIKGILGSVGESWCYIGRREWWGRGIGGRFLDLSGTKARELGLTHLTMKARADNQRSIRAYEKNGFVRDPEQLVPGLVTMTRSLIG